MKYYIEIEGGFTGIPRILDGEVQLDKDTAEAIFSKLEEPAVSDEADWPDALNYYIVLEESGQKREAHFSEACLPELVRDFLDKISGNK